MTDENEKQAAALVEALAPKIAEAILPKISENVEQQLQGLKHKNHELLDKLSKQKDETDAAKAAAAESARVSADGTYQAPTQAQSIKLKRSDARDVRKYQDAKALAAKSGVPLEIVPDA